MYKGHVAFEYEIQLVFLNKKLRFVLPIAVPYNKKKQSCLVIQTCIKQEEQREKERESISWVVLRDHTFT